MHNDEPRDTIPAQGDRMVKSVTALARKAGRAGKGAAKRRGDSAHYSAMVSARWSDGQKRRRSCVVCGRRVLATSREFEAVGRTCEEHRKG